MKIKQIYYSSHFARVFGKLSRELQVKAVKKEKLFRKDCFSKSLRTHKLQGGLKEYWAFSIDYSHRIVFEFLDQDKVAFIDVGNHSIYR